MAIRQMDTRAQIPKREVRALGEPPDLGPEIWARLQNGVLREASGGHELVIQCPRCGTPRLYINRDTGVYQCFRCAGEVRGQLPMVMWPRFGTSRPTPVRNSFHLPAAEERAARRDESDLKNFLRRRKISHEVVAYVGAYLASVQDRPSLVLPWNQYHRHLANYWIARALDNDDPKYIRPAGAYPKEAPSIYLHDGGGVMTWWYISPVIYVVEGPLDVLRWLSFLADHPEHRAHKAWGTRVVALGGLTLNEAGAKVLREWRWSDQVSRRVVWVLDNDEAGHEAVIRYDREWSAVPGVRSRIWHRPGFSKDPGEWTDMEWRMFWGAQTSELSRSGLLEVPPLLELQARLYEGRGSNLCGGDGSGGRSGGARGPAGGPVRWAGGEDSGLAAEDEWIESSGLLDHERGPLSATGEQDPECE